MPDLIYNSVTFTGKGDRAAELASTLLGKSRDIIEMSHVLSQNGISENDPDYDKKFYQLYQEQLAYLKTTESESSKEVITFSKLAPMPIEQLIDFQNVTLPTDLLSEPYDIFTNGWYRWRMDHWGTKWDAYGGNEIEFIGDIEYAKNHPDQECTITAAFVTAWGGPKPIFDILKRLESDVHISIYSEDELSIL